MFVQELQTDNSQIRLIKPDIERDANLGVEWINGEIGRKTLELMGNPPEKITNTTINAEKERVREFLEKEDKLNWMIEVEGNVVGAIWVDLVPRERLMAPAIHIMIGDSSARGKGVGAAASNGVINWLISERGEKAVYTRHLADNSNAALLIYGLGFQKDGETYLDKDGLNWQNAIYEVTHD